MLVLLSNWKITIVLCAVATVCFGTQVFPVHRPVCTHYTLIFYQAVDMFVDMTLLTYWLQLKQRWPDFFMSKKKKLSTQLGWTFLSICCVHCLNSPFLWFHFRILFAGHTKEQPGESLHLSSPFCLVEMCLSAFSSDTVSR